MKEAAQDIDVWTVRKELDAKAGSSEARARGPLHGREQTRQAFVVMLIVVLLQLVLLSDAFRGTGTRTFLLTTRPPTRPSPLEALLDQLINTNTPLPRHHPLNLIKPPFDLINRRLLSHSNGIRITIKNNDSLPRHKPLVILALRLQDLLLRPSAKSSRRLRRGPVAEGVGEDAPKYFGPVGVPIWSEVGWLAIFD